MDSAPFILWTQNGRISHLQKCDFYYMHETMKHLLPEFNNYSKKWTKIDESFAKMHAEKIVTHQKKIACGITLGRESPLTSVKNVSNRTHTRDMFMLKIK